MHPLLLFALSYIKLLGLKKMKLKNVYCWQELSLFIFFTLCFQRISFPLSGDIGHNSAGFSNDEPWIIREVPVSEKKHYRTESTAGMDLA